jgi:LysM repeat protein
MKPTIIILFFLFINLSLAQQSYEIYTVSEGETAYSISKKFEIQPNDLYQLNPEITTHGLKIGQRIQIPVATNSIAKSIANSANTHQVLAKETLFAIARNYNVSVDDLTHLNQDMLTNGLQIDQELKIPNKKKTLDGSARIITQNTIFHTVLPKETKYGISKKYGITIEQLETQNPEIVNGLVAGNKLAINTAPIKPANENEELMVALAEKQFEVEKNKNKNNEIQDLKDKLAVQEEINQKILKINHLKLNLTSIDWENGNNPEQKLKLVLETNKNVQYVLKTKLDSLVNLMERDLHELKKNEITDVATAKRLQKETYESILKTNKLSQNLKQELAQNRKDYTEMMFKVQTILTEQNQEYKRQIRDGQKAANINKIKSLSQLDIDTYNNEQEELNNSNLKLISKIENIDNQKATETKIRISKATFYSLEARTYDDKIAQKKIERYRAEALSKMKPASTGTHVEVNPNDYQTLVEQMLVFENVSNAINGIYLKIDEFQDANLRDDYVMNLIDSGYLNANFFFNINSLSYYIYIDQTHNLNQALAIVNQNQQNPLYKNLQLVQLKYNLKN